MERIFKISLVLVLGIAILSLVMICSEEHTYVIKTPTSEYTVDGYHKIQNSSCVSFYVKGQYKVISGDFEITQIK
jgi:hypothetical protein